MALLPFRSKKSLAYCVLSLPLVVGCTITTGPAQPATQTPAAVPPPPPPAATPAQPQANNDDNWEGEDEATRRPRAHDNIDRRRARPQIGGGTGTEPTPSHTGSTPASTPAASTHRTVGLDPTGETRTNEVIGKVIRDNRQPFRDCYERGAAKDPNLQGTLTLHFVLDPDGRVKLAELNDARSTIKDANVVNCAIGVLKSLRFPASSRGMESVANYPFDFKR
jgi:outer membrane biosynthesis protein TonB